MRINADFTKPVELHPSDTSLSPSPAPGVNRTMLDRIGDEVARATTIVQFDRDKYFPEHSHDGGEEFFVLEGTFSDQYGDFPAGTYVRNPIGTSHSPHTVEGCTIFVKLWQFDKNDAEQKSVNTNNKSFWTEGCHKGQTVLNLHEFESEKVTLQKWDVGSNATLTTPDKGMEVLVVTGELQSNGRTFPKRSWLRYPAGTEISYDFTKDTTLLVKTGHIEEA
ncbi:cupin domain-containing protein [Kiloniella majae]|uniref:cupin domain-containing protein n=1 Tax=Kiloniella majae TaxID=1938558 RepID=UPI000A2797BA|nr:cupin domain-containing protein [Kiloniella majae]